jgi:hypothetical protein
MPQFIISSNDETGEKFVTVIHEGTPLVASDTHPNFEQIAEALLSDDPVDYPALFDVSVAVAKSFTNLSERVAVANGHVYFDGDLVDGSCERQIVRFLDEGVEDFTPLVKFMENIAANPNEHSRTQLYDWLTSHDFTITPEGNIVGYKGVTKQDDDALVSGFSGRATVDGKVVEGRIPNAVGSVITMPRSEVQHDPSSACSTGLHVGTFAYARGYANGAMLRVDVNPRDVVSVPTDARGEKVRVCRYVVKDVIDAPDTRAYATDPDDLCHDEAVETDDYRDTATYQQGWDDYKAGRGGITATSSEDYDEGYDDAEYDD